MRIGCSQIVGDARCCALDYRVVIDMAAVEVMIELP
jgi:hypothetical protein